MMRNLSSIRQLQRCYTMSWSVGLRFRTRLPCAFLHRRRPGARANLLAEAGR